MSKQKSIVNDASVRFLEKYVNNPSPVSYEWKGQKLWIDYLKPYVDEVFIDNYGTAVGTINPGKDYKVVIEAHADEISWFVNYIKDDGIIYVSRNGGSDHQIAPSKRVNIHTMDGGVVKGVFGWPAIHTRKPGEKEEVPSMKNIFVDCGCTSKEEVEKLGIHVGCVITFDDEFMMLNDRYYVGRALDNRMGGFMIAETARMLKEQNIELPYTLHVVNSVQEEIGLRGAEMIAHKLKPDVAIVTDVTHDTQTPLINKVVQGDLYCGKGPVISFSPAVHNNLNKVLIDSAKKASIPYQFQTTSRTTGTDTDSFAYSNEGVVSALISVSLRYMHTTVEMVHKEDVDNVIRLFLESLKAIQYKQDFKYFQV